MRQNSKTSAHVLRLLGGFELILLPFPPLTVGFIFIFFKPSTVNIQNLINTKQKLILSLFFFECFSIELFSMLRGPNFQVEHRV